MKKFFEGLLMGGIGIAAWLAGIVFLGISTFISFYIGWLVLQWLF